jgi:hypothetical protein
MAVNRIALIGLSVLVLSATTTIALAQNTSNPLRTGNTVNPILSGNTVAAGREAPVLSSAQRPEPVDWNESVYGPALLRATNNWRHHDVSWSGISERLRTPAFILYVIAATYACLKRLASQQSKAGESGGPYSQISLKVFFESP